MSPTNLPIVQPYLFFGGRCEEAIAYYAHHLHAQIGMILRFRENPDAGGDCPGGMPLPPEWGEKIMHCSFTIGASLLMCSDGMEQAEPAKTGAHCMSLTLPDEAEAHRVFTALADGGQIAMPLGKTFWSPCFGMTTDRFGIHWMITTPE